MASTRSTQRSHASLRLIDGGASHPPTDEELALALRSRAPGAEKQAWNLYCPLVRGLLRRRLTSAADVDDLTQEVFMRLFVAVHRLKDPTLLRSFLVGIVIRVIRGELRKEQFRRLLSFRVWEVTSELSSPPANAGLSAVQRLERILDRLGTETRLLFVLRYVEQLELSEIESALGWSHSTTKRRLKRASELVFEASGRDSELAPYLSVFEKGEP